MKHDDPKPMGCSKSSSKREVYSYTSLPKETRKKLQKTTNTWRLNNILLLNNQWITEEIKEEIKKYLDANENENTTIQNLWDPAKAVLRGNFTVVQAYLRK